MTERSSSLNALGIVSKPIALVGQFKLIRAPPRDIRNDACRNAVSGMILDCR